jgi:rhodanese-related sulfurtransferase
VCRHFPDLCPPAVIAVPDAAAAPSKNEQLLASMLENLKNPYDSVAVSKLAEELSAGARPLIVDVRPGDQFAVGHVPGAVNIPQADLPTRAAELPEDRDAPIVMVCAIGRTSKETTLYLKSLGYRHVRNLKGGITEWMRKGQKTETA